MNVTFLSRNRFFLDELRPSLDVRSEGERPVAIRAFLDSGSNWSLVDDGVLEALRARGAVEAEEGGTIGIRVRGELCTGSVVRVRLMVSMPEAPDFSVSVSLVVLERLRERIPGVDVVLGWRGFMERVSLAIVPFARPSDEGDGWVLYGHPDIA